MYSPERACYKLAGFGWAATSPSERTMWLYEERGGWHMDLAHVVELLAYQSPEQTGRVNRSIDFRSDVYSLVCIDMFFWSLWLQGATFYKFLTGHCICNWEKLDPLEIIHFTVSRYPEPVSKFVPNVPLGLVTVIDLMLEKNKEDRVQVRSPFYCCY